MPTAANTDKPTMRVQPGGAPPDRRGGPVTAAAASPIPEALAQYLTARDRQRTNRVQQFLDSLPPREELLIREAAVMGFVLGVQHGRVNANRRMSDDASSFPGDADIVASVVAHCQSTSDLYPLIGGDLRTLVEWIVRRHQPVAAGSVATAAAALTAATVDEVTEVIAGLVEDELLVEGIDGLRVAS